MFDFLVWMAIVVLVLLMGGVYLAIEYANIVQIGKDIDEERKKKLMKKKK